MNQTVNLDRIIDEAYASQPLTGPQTGTAPAPRMPRYDAPADKPVVEFDAGDDDRGAITPVQARALLGEFFDDFPKDLLASMAIEYICGRRSAAIPVLLGEWAEAYSKGLVSQPMGPKAFARYAAGQYECGYEAGAA